MRAEEVDAPYLRSWQYGSGVGDTTSASSATHDTSRVSYHVKHLDTFAQTLQDVSCASCARLLPRHLCSHGPSYLVREQSLPKQGPVITSIQEGSGTATTLEIGRPLCLARVGGSREMFA